MGTRGFLGAKGFLRAIVKWVARFAIKRPKVVLAALVALLLAGFWFWSLQPAQLTEPLIVRSFLVDVSRQAGQQGVEVTEVSLVARRAVEDQNLSFLVYVLEYRYEGKRGYVTYAFTLQDGKLVDVD